jgi:hypothetical protein
MDENNNEIEPLKEQQQLPKTSETEVKTTALLEKRKTLSKRPSTSKKTEKPIWLNTFAFLNDAKREKLMQVPELPVTVKKSKKKLTRSKSAKVTKSEFKTTDNKNDDDDVKKKLSNNNSDESDNEKDLERRGSNKSKSASDSSTQNSSSKHEPIKSLPLKQNDKQPTQSKKSNLKRPKFKTTIDLDKINYDNNFNYHDDLHYSIDQALNNLHVSTTYKNLIRSMKANV